MDNVNPASPNPLPNITQEAADLLKSTEVSPEYPNVFPVNLPGGRIYIDSTPNKENVYIRHKSGSFIYFEPNGDIFIHSPRDIKVCAERNLAVKVGEGSKDMCMIQVAGNASVKVEGDLTTEVGGNKSETISGNYNLQVKGTYSSSANTRNTKTTGTHTDNAHEKVNNQTFVKNNIGIPDKEGVGGEVRDIIFGSRVIEMADPRGVFTIKSVGFLELTAGTGVQVLTPSVIGLTSEGPISLTSIAGINLGTEGPVSINANGPIGITSGATISAIGSQIFLN